MAPVSAAGIAPPPAATTARRDETAELPCGQDRVRNEAPPVTSEFFRSRLRSARFRFVRRFLRRKLRLLPSAQVQRAWAKPPLEKASTRPGYHPVRRPAPRSSVREHTSSSSSPTRCSSAEKSTSRAHRRFRARK